MSSNKENENKLHYFKNRAGEKYGRLTALEYLYTNKRRKAVWLCKCDCGNIVQVSSEKLSTGNTKSCGCLHSDKSKEKIKILIKKQTKYTRKFEKELSIIFNQMKQRCYNKKCKAYKNYGERGIKICDEWLDDFNSFYLWSTKNNFNSNLSIDRIDVNGNYEPNNCRWITNLEQQNNKRNNKYLEFNGQKHTYAEWSRILNIPSSTISDRIKRGYDTEQILNINYKKRA